MATKATEQAFGNDGKSGRRTLKNVLYDQGRTMVWLSRQTGYHRNYIQRVAAGKAPETERFHIAMEKALGEAYDR